MKYIGFVVMTFLCLASAAHAEKRDNSVPWPEPDRTVTVPVPVSQLPLEPLRYQPPTPVEYGLSVSNYVPNRFSRPMYDGSTTTFSAGDVPAVSAFRVAELAKWGQGLSLSSRLGLRYLVLSRSGSPVVDSFSVGSTTENVNLLSAQIGIEGAWRDLLPWGLAPAISFSVWPTWVNSTSNALENSVSAFGIPLEATLGLQWRPPFVRQVSFAIMGQGDFGSVGGSSLKGYGAAAEARFSL